MHKRGKFVSGLAAFLIVVSSATGLSVVAAPSADAAGTPAITLTEQVPPSVLYGTTATIHLTATNPTGQAGFNLSFNDALPLGVTYVPGSTVPSDFGDPQIVTLASGAQTLVWSNVADLQPNSSQEISFKVTPAVEPDPNAIAPGVSYTDAAGAYVNSDPRYQPQFDPTTGAAIAGATSYTGSDTASGTTTVTAISVSKVEPSPETELPRGVHDHQTVYTHHRHEQRRERDQRHLGDRLTSPPDLSFSVAAPSTTRPRHLSPIQVAQTSTSTRVQVRWW